MNVIEMGINYIVVDSRFYKTLDPEELAGEGIFYHFYSDERIIMRKQSKIDNRGIELIGSDGEYVTCFLRKVNDLSNCEKRRFNSIVDSKGIVIASWTDKCKSS